VKKRPLIGITCATVRYRGRLPGYQLNQQYVQAVQDAGGTPVLIPHGDDPKAALNVLDSLDGVLFPGGADVGPERYGEEPIPALGQVDEELDALELPLASAAVARRTPVLAICRGQQVVNVALGGTLYQDLKQDGVTRRRHRTPFRWGRDYLCHEVELDPASVWGEIAGARTLRVNSFHHQAVKDVAAGLRVTAMSPDGVIEGLESEDGRLLAVQCHPEGLTAHAWSRDLFSHFVELAAS
jgi:putative glutamine amidotransferase